MSQEQVNQLKDKLFKKKSKYTKSGLTDIFDIVRSFSCLGEIIGREFSVYNKVGKLKYTIKQKPIGMKQLNLMLKELNTLQNNDIIRENEKWSKK